MLYKMETNKNTTPNKTTSLVNTM